VGPIETAGENEVAFVRGSKQNDVHFGTAADGRHLSAVKPSLAGAVITGMQIEDLDKPQLIVKDVNAALIEALNIFAPNLKPVTEGIDPSA
jgi:hypothetical protein